MKKFLKKYLVYLVMMVAMGNLVAFFIDPTFIGHAEIWLRNTLFSILLGFPMMKLNEFIIVHIGRRIKWESSPLKRFFLSLFIIIVLATLITLLLNYVYCYRIYHSTFAECIATTLNMLFIEILIIVYIFTLFTGIEFFKMWREGLIRQELLQRKAIELQMEALKNQVNPHFLFNSLSALTSLVYKDADKAAQFIQRLSDIYRYVLEHKQETTVPWSAERKFVENYIRLQQVRFADNIDIIIDTDRSEELGVVPLSVQMLVENAIKHNIVTTDNPLKITIYHENNCLVVRNNLQLKTSKEYSENIGLDNIRKQYEILTGKRVEVSKEGGYFTVRLPIIHTKQSGT
jgi:sensor histidine kinase YesM